MNSFEWQSAHSVAEASGSASALVADAMVSATGEPPGHEAVIFKAGGIDLLDLIKQGLLTPRRIVNLREIAGLGRVEAVDEGVRIGSMVTLSQLARDPLIRDRFAALAATAGAAASPQIREMATIGGNLLQRPRCWYFRSPDHHCVRKGGSFCFAFAGDNRYHAVFGHNGCAIVHPSTAATLLVALGAKVELTSLDGGWRVVQLETFFVPPEIDIRRENDLMSGEVLTAVLLPASAAGLHCVHLKQGEKDFFDWPIADVAVALDLDPQGVCRSASVVLGAAAPTPHRAKAAERALIGNEPSEQTAALAARAALTGAVALGHNAYKLPLFETLVRRAILGAAASLSNDRT